MLKSWLEITENGGQTYTINSLYDYQGNAIKNKIWYRGDPYELYQFYSQSQNRDASFWSVVSQARITPRMIHTGLPSLIVDTLAGIIVSDYNGVEIDKKKNDDGEVIESEYQKIWDEIEKDNNFDDLLEEVITVLLHTGDGAFKFSLDTDITEQPILEFFSGDKIEFEYNRGRFQETIFKTNYTIKNKKYVHLERYGFGYIKHELRTFNDDKEVPLSTIPELANLQNVAFGGYREDSEGNVITKGTFNMSIPVIFKKSSKFKGRGESIFDKKISNFDAFDEIVSQWLDAFRSGRAREYIPTSMIPRSKETGELLRPNPFDSRFIPVNKTSFDEGKAGQIEVVQAAIPSENYLESYITILDLCLQGVISPSTLGIDTKKLDNAEAQREKEKTTLQTRGRLVTKLRSVIPEVVEVALNIHYLKTNKLPPIDLPIDVNFGEYANPSFEAVVETVVKGKQGQVMSIRSVLDELYGDTKDDVWKKEEEARIKEENGIMQVEEPTVTSYDGELDVE
jgi:hypothetical protein